MVDELWPVDGAPRTDELEAHYRYPEGLRRPWVRANMISSLDGAVSVDGSSRPMSGPADRKVLSLIRDLSDVVLVGLSTAVAEDYRGIRRTPARAERRDRLGLSRVPPLALVTSTASLAPDSPLLTDTEVPPIVLTCAAAPAADRDALAAAGADVVIAGDERVDLTSALAELDARGLRRVGCEGGPRLLGALLDQDLVDELCLTLSPTLTSGDAGRIATSPGAGTPRGMRLESVLHADSMLLLRYGRMRE
ncbi:pyrimidine reductase family protein [Saccharopolyspora griseoalba]|uniref:Pyrimidine reductase family protein n=1 Tax=Saccharopolyspora griseoalba TaxID=1431848 RepID=A0ABW2LRQ7_9PSEU